MTSQIEQLLEMPVSQLEMLSDTDLTARVIHYFPITRPEQAPKQDKFKISPSPSISRERQIKLDRARMLAKQAGIDLGI